MKKILSGILATAMVASMASMSVFATVTNPGAVFNGDLDEYLGGRLTAAGTAGSEATKYASTTVDSFIADGIVPATTVYYSLGDMNAVAANISAPVSTSGTATTGYFTPATGDTTARNIGVDYLVDTNFFKFKLDKDDNAKMVNSVSVVSDKKLDSSIPSHGDQRAAFLKFVLNDSLTTSEIKATGSVTFTARKAPDATALSNGEYWAVGDKFTYNYTMWINNEERKGSDADADTGDRVYFNPESNETNTFVWGDDRAAIEFNADDDASKFYCRLSTSNNASIYAEYGDPVGANLWFFDFVGNMNIPSTSRAALTLGIPWDQDKDIVPNISDIYIYSVDADGNLIDVTDQFKYSEDDYEIEGWTTQTRVLGSYIMSDTELDIGYDDGDLDDGDLDVDIGGDIDVVDPSTSAGADKDIPNTGSSDMVSVAVVAAVVSLAAAGAVAFKKASK